MLFNVRSKADISQLNLPHSHWIIYASEVVAVSGSFRVASVAANVYGTVGCPSVRPSVPSIDSSSDVQLFAAARARAADIDRYRSVQ